MTHGYAYKCREVTPGCEEGVEEAMVVVTMSPFDAARSYTLELLNRGNLTIDDLATIEVTDEGGGVSTYECTPEIEVSVRAVYK